MSTDCLLSIAVEADARLTQFSKELDNFLRVRFDYRKQIVRRGIFSVNVNVKKIHLFIRFQLIRDEAKFTWPEGTLVIAAISVLEERAGHARALLEFLVQVAGRFGFNQIGLECTREHEGIQGFARSFFEEAWLDCPTKNYYWIAPIADIAKKLSRRTNNDKRSPLSIP